MYRGQGMPDHDEGFGDYGDDDYDDEYGSQSYGGQGYYGRQGNEAIMGGLNQLEGSGGSGEYDEEEMSDDSRIRAHYMRQEQAMRMEQAKKQAQGSAFGAGQKGAGFQGGIGGQDFGGMGLGAKAAFYQQAAAKPSGGFTYGQASGAGSLFGAASAAGGNTFSSGLGQVGQMGGLGAAGGTQFGVQPKAGSGGFVLGGASQFGGMGAGAGGLFGAPAAADDPYNIDIDLTKIKKTNQPAKTFEEKSAEEKKSAMMQFSKETEAAGAKSIIKNPAAGKSKSKSASVSFGQCQVYEYEKDPTTSNPPKRVDTKDISDMRDNRTKMKDLLQEQENKQLESIRRNQERMKEKTSGLAASPPKDKFKSSSKASDSVEDSIAESGSLSVSADKRKSKRSSKVSESQQSYDTDTFEDQSQSISTSKEASGSKKQGLNYWKGSKAAEVSTSGISQSKDASIQDEEVKVVTNDVMAEYMRKQEEKKKAQSKGTVAKPEPVKKEVPKRTSKDISESSDKYTDEDFESISKSQGQMGALPKMSKPSTIQASQFSQQSRIVNTYVKKESKFVQTVMGKYDYMDEIEEEERKGDRYLQRELEDAERLIQLQKGDKAEYNQELLQIELELKKARMQKDAARHDARNADATNERLTEKLKQQMHDLNRYRIETEELIKQIDMADAKTRDVEERLALQAAEYDKKLQLQEKQIEFRRAKQDNREVTEMRREYHLKLEEARQKTEELESDLDYFKTKTEKLEAENSKLRLSKGDNKRMRELENEIELLKNEGAKSGGGQPGGLSAPASNIDLKNIKKSLSPDEQVQLQREIQQLDLMLKGYEGENQKLMRKQKADDDRIKELATKLNDEENNVKKLKLKAMEVKGEVFVEKEGNEVPMVAQNVLQSKAISHKQLEDLHQTVKQLQEGKDQARKDMVLQADQFKAQINRLRDEKSEAEQRLFQVEFVANQKERDVEKLKEETTKQIRAQDSTIEELQNKLQWFRENQKLLNEGDEDKNSVQKELNDLRIQSGRVKDDKKRIIELEKKCRLLEDTLKAKNPNSIGMLIQATKTDAVREDGTPGNRELQEKVRQLTYELDVQDKEFERKLRAMRQEQERMKQLYDKRAGQSEEAKQVKELEDELQKTKTYYNKRIRETEDKYKYGMGKAPKGPAESGPKSNRSNQSGIGKGSDLAAAQQEIQTLKDQVQQLKREGSLLAQKAADAEQRNNIRRNSLAGSQAGTPRGGPDATENSIKQDIQSLFYQGQPDGADGGNQRSAQKPQENLNPFDLNNQNATPSKSIPEILEIMQKVNLDKTFKKKQVKINDMYKVLTGELGVAVNIIDIKNLNRYLQNKQSQNEDEDNYMDKDENLVDIDFLKQMFPQQSNPSDKETIRRLKDDLRSAKNNQGASADAEYAIRKAQNLQREISEVENDKRDLQQRVNKLEAQKSRLEQVFKSTMKGGNMDLIDEVQMLVRRIEFLEEQSDKRVKNTFLENQEPYMREIEMLKSKLVQEREMRDQIVQKKNAEVSYFKAELDALLSEMQNQFKKKQASQVK